MKNRNFTIYHGIAGSLALHLAMALFIVVPLCYSEPDLEDTLLVEFQGTDSDIQSEERVRQQSKSEGGAGELQGEKEGAAEINEGDEPRPDPTMDEALKKRARDMEKGGASTSASNVGGVDVEGANEQQSAQSIQRREEEQMNLLKAYVKALSKKIQAKLVYPREGRHAGLQGVATVSFRILQDGSLHPESVKIVASSGNRELDASALDTISACAPFAPPPKEVTVTMAVTYSRRR